MGVMDASAQIGRDDGRGRVTNDADDAQPRTNTPFREMADEDHHAGASPFAHLEIQCLGLILSGSNRGWR